MTQEKFDSVSTLATQGNVTLDLVRSTLIEHEIDPFATNASKVRELLGRGSFQTIQKHLTIVRNERIAAQAPTTTDTIPRPPADIVESLWAAAWTAAQAKTLTRLDALSTERDGLAASVEAMTGDLGAATSQLDEMETALAAAQAAQAEAETRAEAARLETDQVQQARDCLL